MGQLQRGAQPGAGFDRAARGRHRGQCRRGCGFAPAPGRRAADPAGQCAGPQLRTAPGDGQPADDVRRRQAPGHPAEHRAAGHAHQQGAVRPELASQAGQPVLAQRPAEHLASAGARRGYARLGWAHGRLACVGQRQAGVHLDLGRGQRGVAGRRVDPAVPGQHQWCDPHGHRRQQPGLRLGRCRRGDAAHRFGDTRHACLRARHRHVGQAFDGCRVVAAQRAEAGRRRDCSARRWWRRQPTTPTTIRNCNTTTR